MTTENKSLTNASPLEVGRPDFIARTTVGADHITKDDLQMPRLGLAQQMSPEVDPSNTEKFMEGLRIGNNLTGQNYGKGPHDIVILRADRPRFIEFFPREQGGGIKDFDVKADDPRTRFGAGGEPPAATKFYDFIVMFLKTRELMALSLKSTGLKVARQLNGLIKMRNAPIYSGLYALSAVQTKNKKGTFYTFSVKNNGWVPDKETYDHVESMFNGLKDKKIEFEREPGSDDVADDDAAAGGDEATSFNPGQM
jgi:hypothetical protein